MSLSFSKIKIMLIGGVFLAGFFLVSFPVLARENVTDWYIQDFRSEIVVNKDSSLDITERITADCGLAAGKHGIFRILPERANLSTGEKIETPVEFLSITDFSGRPIKFVESRNFSDKTVTWKIGDPNQTVQGVNEYEIHYRVKNAIRFSNPNFDELYWNLNGNFWDLETDAFSAKIVFPSEITEHNSGLEYYTGTFGEKRKDLATFSWTASNVLEFQATKTLPMRNGITVSIVFPKNILVPYVPGFFEAYGEYFFLLVPLVVFFVCFYLWWRFGKDPRMDKSIVPEYEAPGNLSPMELGMLQKNGAFNNKFVTAEIINLAVQGFLTIRETEEKILFFKYKDYELNKKENIKMEVLNKAQKSIMDSVFAEGAIVKLSSLKNKFYKSIRDIDKKAKDILAGKKLIVPSGLVFQGVFLAVGAVLVVVSFFVFSLSVFFSIGLFFSGIMVIIFGLFMPKRTPAGAALNWQIKGFKMFMETVDKDRAAFYEKENIFEKFLPYAIVFGITEIWINRMKEIYGEEYFSAYRPVWYSGALGSFSAESFSSTIDSLSSSIAASTSSPSGSGGAGGSGGGGGGGGGGGW